MYHIPLSLTSSIAAVTADIQIDRSNEYDSYRGENNSVTENDVLKVIDGSESLIPLRIDDLCDSESNQVERSDKSEDSTGRERFWVNHDSVTDLNFTCPKCGRIFPGDWTACDNHVTARKHGRRCTYALGNSLSCLSEHSMLPLDEHSGWCELQGRRKYMEDMHSIVFEQSYKLFAVFDGHSGTKSARFASRRLHALFDIYLSREETPNCQDSFTWQKQAERLGRINTHLRDPITSLLNLSRKVSGSENFSLIALGTELLVPPDNNQESFDRPYEFSETDRNTPGGSRGTSVAHGISAMHEAFAQTNIDLSSTMTSLDSSGSTASVVVLFRDHLLVANIGDSRVILCCSTGTASSTSSFPVRLTVDHTPYDVEERSAVESRGGFVTNDGVHRVNGKLAVSRSFGDYSISSFISAKPDITVLRLRYPLHLHLRSNMGNTDNSIEFNSTAPLFSIDATDLQSRKSLLSRHCDVFRSTVQNKSAIAGPKPKADIDSYLEPLFLIIASGETLRRFSTCFLFISPKKYLRHIKLQTVSGTL